MIVIEVARDEAGNVAPTMVGSEEVTLFTWERIGKLSDQIAVVVINMHPTATVTAYLDTCELQPYLDERISLQIPPLQQRSISVDSLRTYYRATAKSTAEQTPVAFTVLGRLMGDHT